MRNAEDESGYTPKNLAPWTKHDRVGFLRKKMTNSAWTTMGTSRRVL